MTPRHPSGGNGELQDLRRAPAFVKLHQAGAAFDSPPDVGYRKIMMMIEILKRMLHNLIGTMYD